jgi:cytochrome c biogenesis protein CcmG, thiol:disulfide interchange protein DsbE
VSVLRVSAAVVTALLFGYVFAGCSTTPRSVSAASVKSEKDRKEAPDFALKDADGKVVHLADYKGKVVLLNVWATWCEPCRVEMPSIEKLHREFGPHGLAVVAVSVDDPGAEQRIRDFAKELGLTFEILHDPKQVTTRNYQITGYPETFVIARDGTIRKKLIGASDWSSEGNRALVRELLGGTTAAR